MDQMAEACMGKRNATQFLLGKPMAKIAWKTRGQIGRH